LVEDEREGFLGPLACEQDREDDEDDLAKAWIGDLTIGGDWGNSKGLADFTVPSISQFLWKGTEIEQYSD